jgi:VanZ family protein
MRIMIGDRNAAVRAWLPVALWMMLMFFGSSDLMSAEHTSRFITPLLRWLNSDISPAAIARVHFFVRKTAHLIEYAILTGLIFRALRDSVPAIWARALIALISVAIFAGADEFHQALVSSRTSSLGDVFLDSTGAIIGIIICWVTDLLLVRRRPPS